MNSFIFICLFGLFAVALSRPSEQYTDKYDNVNIDEILANERLLVPYIKCLLDQGKCSPDGKELKGHVVDALETECSKCSDKHKIEARKVIKHVINHHQDYWTQLNAKYDPSKKYVTKYENELKGAAA